MQLKVFQLNMWAGKYMNELSSFLSHNYFDVLCFQEVAGIGAKHGNVDSKIDCFKELESILKNTHKGELAISQFDSSNPKTGYFGIAIFYPKDFSLISKNVLTLFERTTPYPSESRAFETMGRNALHLSLQKESKTFEVITTHLALAKDPQNKSEDPHQIVQNTKFVEYMKSIKNTFIMTGDFNIEPNQKTVIELNGFSKNVTAENNVKNTMDPTTYVYWKRVKPGVAIDYVFVTKDVKVTNFSVLENNHISDHYALSTTVEI